MILVDRSDVACLISYLRLRPPPACPAGRYPALERLAEAAEALPAFQAMRPAQFETAAFASGLSQP